MRGILAYPARFPRSGRSLGPSSAVSKASKVRYSRWDGTQVGLRARRRRRLGEITDDLLYHGDLNAALRRMMQSGLRRPQRRAHPGPARDAREAAPQPARAARAVRPRRRLRRHRPGAPRRRRHGARRRSTSSPQEAAESGDARRQEITDEVVAERRMRARHAAARPRRQGARSCRTTSSPRSEAREQFEELVDQLRQQLMQSYFNQMSGAMSDMSPEDMARMKDMLAELNQMLEQRAAGRGARLRGVHGALRRLLPREPAEPRRAARGHGPAHGGHAGDAQLDDARAAGAAAGPVRAAARGHGPALADGPARANLQQTFPRHGLGPALRLRGPGPARLRRGRRR